MTISILWLLVLGMGAGLLITIIIKSIYTPGARKIQAIMLFGKLYDIIANIEGKTIFKGPTEEDGPEMWEIIDGEDDRIFGNIHLFLWPFCKLYTYPFTYTKEKKIGEERDDDVVIWKDEKTRICFVSRSGISDHLEWRVEYPTVTLNLDTKELASVITFTNNMIEVTNPAKVFFGIKNWLEATYDVLSGGLRGLVAKKTLHDLNQYSSEEKNMFNEEMKEHANTETIANPTSGIKEKKGLPTFGLYLFKSVFKDFDPANDTAVALMKSYVDVTIAEQTGKAKVELAKKDVEVAKEKAKAYEAEQEKIVLWRKKFLVDTGLAKTDATGNIIELIADPTTKLSTEALKELSKLTGTLVLDSGSLNKIFSITSTKKEDEK